MKRYQVRQFPAADSQGAKDALLVPWHLSENLDDFSYPWERRTFPQMEFRAMHNQSWLHCNFRATDQDIKVYRAKDEKIEVLYGDRVEIFFARDPSLNEYYCLEIDPYGRVYDYKASFYRKFDDLWAWPPGEIVVSADYSDNGYNVTLSLSMQSLKDFGLIKDRKMLAGIFRGDCSEIDLQNENMRWISWVKPDSSHPDFHIPSAFGEFQPDS
jgi:hypothetical protein